MIHHYLFFILNNEVKVFRHRKNEISSCRRDGLPAFPFCGWDELWAWWKNMSGMTSRDTVDFFFISDINMEFTHPFTTNKTSCWGRLLLESFFTKFCDASQIDLVWESGSKIRIKDTPTARLPEKAKGQSFFIFPPLNEIEVNHDVFQKDETLYNHFHEEIEKNKKRNLEK